MSSFKVCSRSGSLYQGTCRCPQCQMHAQADGRRRNAKAQQDGRSLRQWRSTTRPAVLARAGNRCELRLRGCTGKATTVHKINGGYHSRNLDAYQAACFHCHGVVDAPKARKQA